MGHDLGGEPAERLDAGGGLAAAEDLGPVDVAGGQVLQCPAAAVLELDPPRGRQRAAGNKGWRRRRAWMEVFSSDVVAFAEGLASGASPPNGWSPDINPGQPGSDRGLGDQMDRTPV